MDIKKGDVRSWYGPMNNPTNLQHIGLKTLINYYDRIDTDMKETANNGYMSVIIVLLNSHTVLQDSQ